MIRRRVPNDHSCLFYALAYLCQDDDDHHNNNNGLDKAAAAAAPPPSPPLATQQLREMCAQTALADPDPVTRALFLGQPSVHRYAEWIRDPHSWGGETEIVMLAQHYGRQVVVVSCETLTTLVYHPDDNDNNNKTATEQVWILYTGQHYDPLVGVVPEAAAKAAAAAAANNNNDDVVDDDNMTGIGIRTSDEVRRFPATTTTTNDDRGVVNPQLQAAALDIARDHNRRAAQRAQQVRVPRLLCGGCGTICRDAADFQEHCLTSSHDDDFAYECQTVEVVLQEGDPELDEFRKRAAAQQEEQLRRDAAWREQQQRQAAEVAEPA